MLASWRFSCSPWFLGVSFSVITPPGGSEEDWRAQCAPASKVPICVTSDHSAGGGKVGPPKGTGTDAMSSDSDCSEGS